MQISNVSLKHNDMRTIEIKDEGVGVGEKILFMRGISGETSILIGVFFQT